MSTSTVEDAVPITLDGRTGLRYWVCRPSAITANREIDDALSAFPVVVFQPEGRDPSRTPLVIGLQGLAAPYQWNSFLVPTLLDMGIACVLFDSPLAGERGMVRGHPGNIVRQLFPLMERGIVPSTKMVSALVDAVAGDLHAVLGLVRDRHSLVDDRVALFGVSLGCLLTALAFARDGLGQRLLGVIGHPDLTLFARSYAPPMTPYLASLPARLLGRVLSPWLGPTPLAAVSFLNVLNELRRGGDAANPMHYAGRVDSSRRVRLLVGEDDRVVKAGDAAACAGRFADGQCYAVPGLKHGQSRFGPSFAEHVRYFVGTQLGDWR